MPAKITIFDTTLRDGELTPGVRYTVDDKVEIARLLAAAGVDVIEVGVPSDSPADVESARAVAAAVPDATLCVIAPCDPDAVAVAGDAIGGAARRRLHLYAHPFGHERAVEHARMTACIRRARELTDDVEFSPVNAMQADPSHLRDTLAVALEAGASTLGLTDTAGRALPWHVADVVRALRRDLGPAILSFHGHNDLGLATANAVAAVAAGARQVEVAVNGLGPRAGNTALEELVTVLATHAGTLDVRTTVDRARLAALSEAVEARSGISVGSNKPVVGRLVRRHAPDA
jgi:2-isopropylmalate synthase